MDGDIIENLEDYKYLGTKNGYRYLFEIMGKEVEWFIVIYSVQYATLFKFMIYNLIIVESSLWYEIS